jgi:hypothetical protein
MRRRSAFKLHTPQNASGYARVGARSASAELACASLWRPTWIVEEARVADALTDHALVLDQQQPHDLAAVPDGNLSVP